MVGRRSLLANLACPGQPQPQRDGKDVGEDFCPFSHSPSLALSKLLTGKKSPRGNSISPPALWKDAKDVGVLLRDFELPFFFF